MVPISLTLPAAAGSQNSQPRVYNLTVPATALVGNYSSISSFFLPVNGYCMYLSRNVAGDQLSRILTPPVISATMALPENVASTLLQQHITAAIQGQASAIPTTTNNTGMISH